MALTTFGKVQYAFTFLVLVPAALTVWAKSAAPVVTFPAVHSVRWGAALTALGITLVLSAMRDLWIHGGGLPMNAAPPTRYVTSGTYRLIPHPIYTGFTLACAGCSITAGSAAGLWLITPITALGCTALVLGYEHHDLRRRFGTATSNLLPPNDRTPSTTTDQLRALLTVVLPWIIAACSLAQPLRQTRTAQVLELLIATTFVLVPFLAITSASLRTFMQQAFCSMLTFFSLALLPTGALICGPSSTRCSPLTRDEFSVPSLTLTLALLSAESFAQRWSTLRWLLRLIALAVGLVLISTGADDLASALEAVLTVFLATQAKALWSITRTHAETLANSWHEWQHRGVRLINHGVYGGAAGFTALWLATVLAGPAHLAAILFTATMGVVGAALWAQWVEGSPQLLRPFGFYGGLLGGTLGAAAAPLFHASPWLILAVFSAGGPWAQGVGRLRCLVQGCCHGAPASNMVGIRYAHPRSRVCRFTQWTGHPLHPTPLYSLLWNALTGLLLLRLWVGHAALGLITGLYFVLSGIGRFAEEAWRGEPQTRVLAGLRLYQWVAIVSLLVGATLTAIGPATPAPTPHLTWLSVIPSILFGMVVGCAMGLDFPRSNRRFSRLA